MAEKKLTNIEQLHALADKQTNLIIAIHDGLLEAKHKDNGMAHVWLIDSQANFNQIVRELQRLNDEGICCG